MLLSFAAAAQTAPYTLHIPVDEISLTFHAEDSSGRPLTALTRDDLDLSDNGHPQRHILSLESWQDMPIRAGFLFDASASVLENLPFNREVLALYASRLLRPGVDRAFVMQFDTEPFITQNWTSEVAAIAAGAGAIGRRSDRYDPLTAIFDSLYIACRDQWKQEQGTQGSGGQPTGNFILIFSDGEDDASHVYLSEAVDMCQRSRTAIYAIANAGHRRFSEGEKTLQTLTEQTGGRLFLNPRGRQLRADLELMEAEQRNQYRLVYKPDNFRADGSFHRIRLRCSAKGAHIVTRSGYYAVDRP